MKRTSLLLLILSLVLFVTPAVHAQTAAQRDTGEV